MHPGSEGRGRGFAHHATIALALAIAMVSGHAAAKPKMPEPILEESITDLDRGEAGELEGDAVFAVQRGAEGRRAWHADVEAEWGVNERVAFAIEAGIVGAAVGRGEELAGVRLGVAYAFFHDWVDDLHVQIEATARHSAAADAEAPGEARLPYALDVRGGYRIQDWTVRTTLGAELGGAAPHVAGRVAVALLGELPRDAGFAGVEVGGDWGQPVPFFVALNFVADATPTGLPMRLGVALPWTPEARGHPSTVGMFVRALVEFE